MPNHSHSSPHTFYSAKYTSAKAILPNHWHAPPHTGDSAKSLAHSARDRQFSKITGTLSTDRLLPNHWHRPFCQITGMLIHIQAILPNHWHTIYSRQFCKITGTGKFAKSLACSSTYSYLCQITGTLLHMHRQSCQITGMLLHIHAILPNLPPLGY